MPLIVKNFTWQQTDELLTIRVPLKGVSANSVDIFTCDHYVKANYPPFLFELFLNSTVNENSSKCTISDNEIIFELQKTIPKIWDQLTADISKIEMLEKRKEIIEKHHQKTEEERKARKEKLTALQRLSVQSQIDRDSKNRKLIEERRDTERTKVMNELDYWVTTKETQEVQDSCPSIAEISKTIFNDSDAGVEIEKKKSKHISPNIEIEKNVKDKNVKRESETTAPLDVFPVPLPRKPGTITINFTHRDFPTPSRESQAPQEEEWLKKQVEARRATGFVAEDLRPEECNPTWLKDKGDSFYKVGNYLGAVSAYSHAIKLGSKMASLYANRGAAHLGLGNLHKALDDCSQVMCEDSEALWPGVSLQRRGHLVYPESEYKIMKYHWWDGPIALEDHPVTEQRDWSDGSGAVTEPSDQSESTALELMTPHVPANLEARAKCYARRGAILCRLGLPEAGLADFEEALKLVPHDSKLQQDIEHAKSLVKNKPAEEEEEEEFDGIQIIPR